MYFFFLDYKNIDHVDPSEARKELRQQLKNQELRK